MLPQYGKHVDKGNIKRHANGKDKDMGVNVKYNIFCWINFGLIVILGITIVVLHASPAFVSHQHIKSLAIKKGWKSYVIDNIKTNTDAFEKYPVPNMVFDQVQMYRLCCRTNEFYICDYGQGATDFGLECMLHTENDKDVFIAIWTGNKKLNKCILYWV